MNMWIFGSWILDMLFLIFPVLGTMALILFTDINWDNWAFAGIVVFTWIDSGHVYTTVLRTYFNREEIDSNKNIYTYAPLVIFATMMLWLLAGAYYLWDFILYATIYHNIRQYYGVTRWYQKNVASKSRWQTRYLYILTVIPVILFHFRKDVPKNIYIQTQLPIMENATALSWGLWVYFAVLGSWLLFQLITLIKNPREAAVSLSALVPIAGYGVGFLLGRNLFEVAAPIIVGHGIGYMGLMTISLNRTKPEMYKSFLKALLITVVLAVVVGSVSDVIEENFVSRHPFVTGWAWVLSSFAIASILTPLLLHYYIDALIWNGKHRESHLVFNKPKSI
ncbi:MAG: hypothetical protein M9899_00405 [Bdellovibrionaceae bacterium]|nr:hypothetical protein [Pseudobdellovibrionaceae bacterium]